MTWRRRVDLRTTCWAVLRSWGFFPLFCLGLGLLLLVASWVGGQPVAGLYGLLIMTGFGLVVLLVSGRSETIGGLLPSDLAG